MEETRFQELQRRLPCQMQAMQGQTIWTIESRCLQRFLGSHKDATDWAKQQIERTKLIENTDVIVFPLKGENPKGGRPRMEYYFTFNAAKKICMMAETDKGDEVREYFLECERRAHAFATPPHTPSTFYEWLSMVESLGKVLHGEIQIVRTDVGLLQNTVESLADEVQSHSFDLHALRQHQQRQEQQLGETLSHVEHQQQQLGHVQQQLDDVLQHWELRESQYQATQRPSSYASRTEQEPPVGWQTLPRYVAKVRPDGVPLYPGKKIPQALHDCVKRYCMPHKFTLFGHEYASNFYSPEALRKGCEDYTHRQKLAPKLPKNYDPRQRDFTLDDPRKS